MKKKYLNYIESRPSKFGFPAKSNPIFVFFSANSASQINFPKILGTHINLTPVYPPIRSDAIQTASICFFKQLPSDLASNQITLIIDSHNILSFDLGLGKIYKSLTAASTSISLIIRGKRFFFKERPPHLEKIKSYISICIGELCTLSPVNCAWIRKWQSAK